MEQQSKPIIPDRKHESLGNFSGKPKSELILAYV